MSGLIGGVVREHLQHRFTLSALNRRAVPGVPCVSADIGDLEAIQPAFSGIDAVVHLAAFARSGGGWDEILNDNIVGTYNVFEAARRAGVQRIVYASSGMATAGWESVMPYRALVEGRYDEVPATWDRVSHETAVRPRGLYGCSKVCESAGKVTPGRRSKGPPSLGLRVTLYSGASFESSYGGRWESCHSSASASPERSIKVRNRCRDGGHKDGGSAVVQAAVEVTVGVAAVEQRVARGCERRASGQPARLRVECRPRDVDKPAGGGRTGNC